MNIDTGDISYCQAELLSLVQWQAALPDSGMAAQSLVQCATRPTTLGCNYASFSCALGMRTIGADCADGWQCQSGFCSGSAFSCGACMAMPQPNDTCTADWQCPGAYFCGNGICKAQGTQGQYCDSQNPCADHYSCISNACLKDDLTDGQTCGPTEGYCDQTTSQLACNQQNTCQTVDFASSGDACPAFGWCRGLGVCNGGICQNAHDVGDPCDPVNGCRWPAVCQAGVCVSPVAENPCDGG
jgi:hypothetical protein